MDYEMTIYFRQKWKDSRLGLPVFHLSANQSREWKMGILNKHGVQWVMNYFEKWILRLAQDCHLVDDLAAEEIKIKSILD